MKKRTVALLCAAVALLGVIFGGTMAWLTRGSDAVVNTFTTASVGLDLTETDREYIMAPGAVLDKDPKVVVDKDSASCYLFVKVEEKNFKNSPISWTPESGWEKVDIEKETVYYREFDETKVDEYTQKDENGNYVFSFLENNQVTVSEDLKKSDMDAYKEAGKKEEKASDAYPQLVFTAYAIQKEYLKDGNGEPLEAPEDIPAIYKLARDHAVLNQTTPETGV